MANTYSFIITAVVLFQTAFTSHTLLNPENSISSYLVDEAGDTIHIWTDQDHYTNAGSAFLTEEGHVVKSVRVPSAYFITPERGSGSIREYDHGDV